MSIETFHKASLVHDDIEDDDAFRYGAETIHRQYGIPTAINVGDYLIGMGYRLVSRESKTLGPEAVSDDSRLPGRRPHQTVRRPRARNCCGATRATNGSSQSMP